MKRSKMSLSHYKLFTCDMGELVPIALTEVLPGDTVQQSTSALIRVSPLLSPVMHPVRVRIHHWFVPYRIIWDEWEDFITGGPNGMSVPVFPTKSSGAGFAEGSLADYFGIPPSVGSLSVSALPFRAYALIFNEFYRDQDLVTELTISKASGVDSTTSVGLLNCAWEKDYFTSARPWTQKGPEVTVPLGSYADVVTDGTDITATAGGIGPRNLLWNSANSVNHSGAATGGSSGMQWANTGMRADLSTATGVSINDLREAFALQRYEEARARYGSRYTEYLRYLGVRSSDARLQRPEYLGGGRQTIQFSEVLQTGTNFDANSGVANLKGHGIGAMRSNRYRRYFEEHGVVVSIMSVLPKTIYASGLPRMWSRTVKEDFWQKELQHIGQQEVLNKEVYAAHATPNGVFGYQDRYDEYRRSESGIAGEFRSTLNYWHMARIFGTTPALNNTFVQANPTKRVLASSATDGLYVMANHSIQARRLVAGKGSSFIF